MSYAPPATMPDNPAAIRDALLEAGDELRGLHAARPDTTDRAAVETWQRSVRAATDFIHLADPVLTAAELRESPRGGIATAVAVTDDEPRTAGDLFVRSEQYEARSGSKTDDVEVRTLLDSSLTDPAAGLFMPVGQPRPPLERRMRLFVRDLIAVISTNLSTIPYIRELNPATNEGGATAVAEGALKPEVTMQFVAADAPVRKLAAWLPITTEIADDAPTLAGYINTRLGYMLALREEAQILNGNGTAPNLRGILNTTGIQTQAFSDSQIESLALGISKVEAVDGEVDGIAMNPTDYWAMLTRRDSDQFDVGQGMTGPFNSGPTGVWGVPVVRTRQLTAGVAIVGAWRLGATLFDRQQTTIRTTDAHSDYFIYNKLVVLAEERVALAVNRPDLFVNVDVSP